MPENRGGGFRGRGGPRGGGPPRGRGGPPMMGGPPGRGGLPMRGRGGFGDRGRGGHMRGGPMAGGPPPHLGGPPPPGFLGPPGLGPPPRGMMGPGGPRGPPPHMGGPLGPRGERGGMRGRGDFRGRGLFPFPPRMPPRGFWPPMIPPGAHLPPSFLARKQAAIARGQALQEAKKKKAAKKAKTEAKKKATPPTEPLKKKDKLLQGWMTSELLELIRERDKRHSRLKKQANPDAEKIKEFKVFRNEVTTKIRSAKIAAGVLVRKTKPRPPKEEGEEAAAAGEGEVTNEGDDAPGEEGNVKEEAMELEETNEGLKEGLSGDVVGSSAVGLESGGRAEKVESEMSVIQEVINEETDDGRIGDGASDESGSDSEACGILVRDLDTGEESHLESSRASDATVSSSSAKSRDVKSSTADHAGENDSRPSEKSSPGSHTLKSTRPSETRSSPGRHSGASSTDTNTQEASCLTARNSPGRHTKASVSMDTDIQEISSTSKQKDSASIRTMTSEASSSTSSSNAVATSSTASEASTSTTKVSEARPSPIAEVTSRGGSDATSSTRNCPDTDFIETDEEYPSDFDDEPGNLHDDRFDPRNFNSREAYDHARRNMDSAYAFDRVCHETDFDRDEYYGHTLGPSEDVEMREVDHATQEGTSTVEGAGGGLSEDALRELIWDLENEEYRYELAMRSALPSGQQPLFSARAELEAAKEALTSLLRERENPAARRLEECVEFGEGDEPPPPPGWDYEDYIEAACDPYELQHVLASSAWAPNTDFTNWQAPPSPPRPSARNQKRSQAAKPPDESASEKPKPVWFTAETQDLRRKRNKALVKSRKERDPVKRFALLEEFRRYRRLLRMKIFANKREVYGDKLLAPQFRDNADKIAERLNLLEGKDGEGDEMEDENEEEADEEAEKMEEVRETSEITAVQEASVVHTEVKQNEDVDGKMKDKESEALEGKDTSTGGPEAVSSTEGQSSSCTDERVELTPKGPAGQTDRQDTQYRPLEEIAKTSTSKPVESVKTSTVKAAKLVDNVKVVPVETAKMSAKPVESVKTAPEATKEKVTLVRSKMNFVRGSEESLKTVKVKRGEASITGDNVVSASSSDGVGSASLRDGVGSNTSSSDNVLGSASSSKVVGSTASSDGIGSSSSSNVVRSAPSRCVLGSASSSDVVGSSASSRDVLGSAPSSDVMESSSSNSGRDSLGKSGAKKSRWSR
ncbi:hypothetical protein M8J77_004568 [Diaphorina citri]|nr:hypothetical protein M8J77_004568 [Diaphorina citri]